MFVKPTPPEHCNLSIENNVMDVSIVLVIMVLVCMIEYERTRALHLTSLRHACYRQTVSTTTLIVITAAL